MFVSKDCTTQAAAALGCRATSGLQFTKRTDPQTDEQTALANLWPTRSDVRPTKATEPPE